MEQNEAAAVVAQDVPAENPAENPAEETPAENPAEAPAENAPEENGETPDGEEGESPEKRREALLSAVRRDAESNARERVIAGWKSEEQELRQLYPNFSLDNELRQNPEFGQLLQCGVSVRRAFEAANFEKIMAGALKSAAANAGMKIAGAIRENTSRAQENPALDRAPAVRRIDVSKLSGEDIMKIIGDVSRGAKISF